MNVCICPHCGFDLVRLEPITDGIFGYDPQVGFLIAGEKVNFDRQCHEIMGSVMAARGYVLSLPVIADRLGYEGDRASELIRAKMTKCRATIAAAGIRFPIQTVWGVGVKWDIDAKPSKRCRHRATSIEAAA